MKNPNLDNVRFLLFSFAMFFCVNTSFAQVPAWPVSKPGCQGLAAEKIGEAVALMENLPESYSLVLVLNGELVSENYFHGSSGVEPHHIRSATKSIMSILIGIAIDNEFIPSVNELISNYFPNQQNLKGITIQHLLDMRSGLDWNEHRGDLLSWQNNSNPNGFLFNKNNQHRPGEKFAYNSATVHLLGHIIEESTGLKPTEFARRYLFQPLDIENIRWMILADGYVNGGYGLEMKPLDLAKIGFLFVNNGKWGDKQVISEAWLKHSLRKNVDFQKAFGSLQNLGYGNLWWNGMKNNIEVYFALGYGGQFLAIIPDLDFVMVATQQWGLADNAMQREDYITNIIVKIIEANMQPEDC